MLETLCRIPEINNLLSGYPKSRWAECIETLTLIGIKQIQTSSEALFEFESKLKKRPSSELLFDYKLPSQDFDSVLESLPCMDSPNFMNLQIPSSQTQQVFGWNEAKTKLHKPKHRSSKSTFQCKNKPQKKPDENNHYTDPTHHVRCYSTRTQAFTNQENSKLNSFTFCEPPKKKSDCKKRKTPKVLEIADHFLSNPLTSTLRNGFSKTQHKVTRSKYTKSN